MQEKGLRICRVPAGSAKTRTKQNRARWGAVRTCRSAVAWRGTVDASLHRIDVDGEVLVVDLLVGAVGADLFERLVELFAKIVVFLANGDADAFADELLVSDRFADQFAAALAVVVLRHPVEQRQHVTDLEIEAAI